MFITEPSVIALNYNVDNVDASEPSAVCPTLPWPRT